MTGVMISQTLGELKQKKWDQKYCLTVRMQTLQTEYLVLIPSPHGLPNPNESDS